VLFLRALIALLVLPGTFAGLIPAWIVSADRWRGPGSWIGIVPLVIGVAILLCCVRDFYVAGKGTLAPWDPPKDLVIVGLYRFVRNPMYVGILILLAGWSFLSGSALLGCYTGLVGVAFHLRVVLYEEPRLKRQFGGQWSAYATSVRRWLPRIKAFEGGKGGGPLPEG
jgi:protein-S-isoprenylcysteine O-methyltransferase Ste14